VLFSDASRIDLVALRRQYVVPLRLLAIGLPLTIVAGALAGVAVFGQFAFIEALLLAIVLAPTDAALGQAVVTDPRIPSRIRQGLNVESGLNDGICVPLLLATDWPSGSPRLGGAGRNNQHRAAGDADQAVGDAAKKRRFEPPAPARADDDDLGILVVGQIGEPFGRKADDHAPFGLAEPLLDGDLFEQSRTSFLQVVARRERHPLRRDSARPPHTAGGGIRGDWDLGHVGKNEPRFEPLCQPRRDAECGLRVGRPVDTTHD
jgi:hypothetical protein